MADTVVHPPDTGTAIQPDDGTVAVPTVEYP